MDRTMDEDERAARAALSLTLQDRVPYAEDVTRLANAERRRARQAMGALLAVALIDTVALVGSLSLWIYAREIGAGGAYEEHRAASIDHTLQVSGALQLVGFVVCAIVFLRWFRIAVRHAHEDRLCGEAGAPMTYTVSEATTYWFYPFLNLVRPYEIMRRLRRVSDADNLPTFEVATETAAPGYRDAAVQYERVAPPRVSVPLGLWWGMYLASNVSGHFVGRYDAETPAELETYGVILITSDLLGIASAIAAVLLIRGIHLNRRELYRRYAHWVDVIGGSDRQA
ncbi:MAG: DUF4328 domain-containing protein [Myxococcota bacterium]